MCMSTAPVDLSSQYIRNAYTEQLITNNLFLLKLNWFVPPNQTLRLMHMEACYARLRARERAAEFIMGCIKIGRARVVIIVASAHRPFQIRIRSDPIMRLSLSTFIYQFAQTKKKKKIDIRDGRRKSLQSEQSYRSEYLFSIFSRFSVCYARIISWCVYVFTFFFLF